MAFSGDGAVSINYRGEANLLPDQEMPDQEMPDQEMPDQEMHGRELHGRGRGCPQPQLPALRPEHGHQLPGEHAQNAKASDQSPRWR